MVFEGSKRLYLDELFYPNDFFTLDIRAYNLTEDTFVGNSNNVHSWKKVSFCEKSKWHEGSRRLFESCIYSSRRTVNDLCYGMIAVSVLDM